MTLDINRKAVKITIEDARGFQKVLEVQGMALSTITTSEDGKSHHCNTAVIGQMSLADLKGLKNNVASKLLTELDNYIAEYGEPEDLAELLEQMLDILKRKED